MYRSSEPPVGIELFAGCGGMSTGFLDAGLRVAAGFELDARAVDAYNYNHNHRGSHGFRVDLSAVLGMDLLKTAGLNSIDFIVGGPPCQPFSIVGKRLGADDDRSNLIGHFIRFVDELRPSVFVLENVPNILRIDSGRFIDATIASFGALGYATRYQVLSAADFGVPQARKRLILIGVRGEAQIRLPAPTHGVGLRPYVTVKEAIGDLPAVEEARNAGVFNHEPTMHSLDMVNRFRSLAPGRREKGSFHDRLHPDRLSYTLRAGSGNFSPLRPVHYEHHRVITVRESARIQGFSDDFIWPDRIPRLQQYRQVGNAVPPPLAKAIAFSLSRQMDWPLDADRLRGVADSRPSPISLTEAELTAQRAARMRGASLGKALLSAAE